MDFVPMLEKQMELNNQTSGRKWISTRFTNKGKPIDWRRCIWLEAAEAVESYPWKHWKSIDASPDLDNLKIELVDIWHFILSLVLQQSWSKKDTEDTIAKANILLNEVLSFHDPVPLETNEQQIAAFESIVRSALNRSAPNSSIRAMISSFFNLVDSVIGGMEKLEALYFGKNTLNAFRQEHGYKEGTYVKTWRLEDKEVEDNVVMMHLAQNTHPSELYSALEREYSKLLEKK